MTVKLRTTPRPNGKHRIECHVFDSAGVMRGFSRREEPKPLFLLGNEYKAALKAETVAKARRNFPAL